MHSHAVIRGGGKGDPHCMLETTTDVLLHVDDDTVRVPLHAVKDALRAAGFEVLRADSWRLRNDFGVVPKPADHTEGTP